MANESTDIETRNTIHNNDEIARIREQRKDEIFNEYLPFRLFCFSFWILLCFGERSGRMVVRLLKQRELKKNNSKFYISIQSTIDWELYHFSTVHEVVVKQKHLIGNTGWVPTHAFEQCNSRQHFPHFLSVSMTGTIFSYKVSGFFVWIFLFQISSSKNIAGFF